MVGVWGKELRREDIYAKELDFLISTSYGPGRYDTNYEQKGLDYPYAYVRWTENRNMEEYLRLLSIDKLKVEPLIQAIYPIEKVEQAFTSLQTPEHPLMILLDYGQDLPKDFPIIVYKPRRVENRVRYKHITENRIRVGIIGVGGFAVGMHLPTLQKLNNKYEILAVCDRIGSTSQTVAQQFGAKYATTDYKEIISDQEIGLIMICTHHNLHGQIVLECLRAGKHTFVEKPLCTTPEELKAIKAFYGSPTKENPQQPLLMVGFNRRFSKYAQEVKKHVQKRINPLFIHYRMNAGYIPLNHWVHTEEGGGRIIGEACHIIDLFSFLVQNPIKAYSAATLKPKTQSLSGSDNKTIILEYEDGSVATLEYFSIGSKQLPKEWMEVHFDEKSILINDYKSLQGYGVKVTSIKNTVSDKGHLEELEILAECLLERTKRWPISLDCIIETTEVTFGLVYG